MKKTINNSKYFLYFKKQLHKLAVVLVILSVFSNLLNIQEITAYYSDTEISNSNSFSTGMLDFTLTNNTLGKIIGPEALGEVSHVSVIMPVEGSLPMQYDLSTMIDTDTSNIDFCNSLVVEAKLNGISKYLGLLPGLENAVTTEFGSWEFRFDLPPTASILNNAKCNANIIFSAWRADIENKIDSGWHDEEILNISLTSRMVVLNEIYARPNSSVAPKDREYIELYNNSNAPVDVLGWQISEIAGTTETFYSIVASGAVSGQVQPYNGVSTIIPAGGFLVLLFGGSASHLNDGGDTVKLYDSTTTLLDSHTYSTIPAGKALMRYPDGIGFWVDPEATPGTENMVSMEDLKLAGFDDDTIAEIIKLAELKNVTLLSDVIVDTITTNPLESDPVISKPEEKLEAIIEEETPVATSEEPKVETEIDEIVTEEATEQEPVVEEIAVEEPIEEIISEKSVPEEIKVAEEVVVSEPAMVESAVEIIEEEKVEAVVPEPAESIIEEVLVNE
jgi:hypothetical protein